MTKTLSACRQESALQGLGIQLPIKGFQSKPGRYIAPLGDDGTSPGGAAALVQPKTGAHINPMPTGDFQPLLDSSITRSAYNARSTASGVRLGP